MNKNIMFLTIISLLLTLTTSCMSRVEVQEAKITLDETALIFSTSPTAPQIINISSNTSWSAISNDDWVSLSPSKGEGDAAIEVSVTENIATEGQHSENRTATITFKAGQSAEETLVVTQEGEKLYFAVNGEANLDYKGGIINIKVDYNTPYEVQIPASVDWVTKPETKAVASENVFLNVAINESTGDRMTNISFVPQSGDTQKITIHQEGKKLSIYTAEDFVNFVTAYNKGEAQVYADANGVFKLEQDIDMTGIEWVPIGKPQSEVSIAYNSANILPNSFTGVFDGQGYTIKNLSMNINIQNTQTMGLFGSLNGATVRNLVLENAKMTVIGKGIVANHVALGLVAGQAANSTIENVTVNGQIIGSATSTASRNVSVGGIVGFALSNNSNTLINSCTFNGAITLDVGEKYSNNSTTVMAGIVGGVSSASSKLTKIQNCKNKANLTVKSHRAAGIVGNAYDVEVSGCQNDGTIDCNYSSNYVANSGVSGVRMGGIMAYNSDKNDGGQIVQNCINTGKISTQQASSVAGGVCGLIKCFHLANSRNTGNVIAPEGFRGLLVGVLQATTDQSSFFNCAVSGKIGAAADQSDAVSATADNYLELAAAFASGVVCDSYTSTNVQLLGEGYDPNKIELPSMESSMPTAWVFSSATSSTMYYWNSDLHCLPATNANSGIIEVCRSEANATVPLKYYVNNKKPYVGTLTTDDYIQFSYPSISLVSGDKVQFNATLAPCANSHKYWIVEWYDGNSWKSDAEKLNIATEDSGLKYTARLHYNSSYQYATINQIIPIETNQNGNFKIRLRAVGDYTCSGIRSSHSNSSADIFFPNYGFSAAYTAKHQIDSNKKVLRILCLGNSFTFYGHTAWKLQELAGSQGYELDIQAHLKGSQTLEQHLSLALTQEAIKKGGYDYAFLQDQSQNPARLANEPANYTDVVTAFKNISESIRSYSPDCKIVIEETWSYPGQSYGGFDSYENFDRLLSQGCKTMSVSVQNSLISPIGRAFALCRSQYPSIKLYHTDNKHQSDEGAYLKACVNYLLLYSEKFTDKVSDCGIEPTTAQQLRTIAETVVLESK